jgi:protein TonB
LGLTISLAILFHAIIILGVGFTSSPLLKPTFETMDIVLVQSRSDQAPQDARILAQANHIGGGDESKPVRPATPYPAPFPASVAAVPTAPAAGHRPVPPAPPQAASQAQQSPTEQKAAAAADRTALAVEKPDAPRPLPKPGKPTKSKAREKTLAQAEPKATDPTPAKKATDDRAAKPSAAPPQPSAAELVARSFAIASLNAEIEQRLEARAKRPRHKFISASTKEYKYAAYMESWRAKVERVGNLNYPEEARRKHLSGSLILDVALNADGSINNITVRRPSGFPVLDAAAIRIVKLAAPYAPFPDTFKNDVDILHITRTWQFINSERFAAGH